MTKKTSITDKINYIINVSKPLCALPSKPIMFNEKIKHEKNIHN